MKSPKYLKVQNTNLVRDSDSKALLETDSLQYSHYKKKRERDLKLLQLEDKLNKVLKMIGEENV